MGKLVTNKIEIMDSNYIRYAYLEDNYAYSGGQLGNSCMRHKFMQKTLNFYIANKVRIAVIKDKNSNIQARALIWDNVIKGKDKITYMDRVYFAHEEHKEQYFEFAKKQGFYTISVDEYKDCAREGNYTYYYKYLAKMYIENINIKNITHFPWIDTFRTLYYDLEDRAHCILANHNLPSRIKCKLRSTSLANLGNSGYFRELDSNAVMEKFSGNWCSKKDCIFVKKYKGYILKENTIKIKNVIYSIHDYDNITRDKYNKYILLKYAVREEFTDEILDKRTAIKIKQYNDYVDKENIIIIEGKKYSKQDPNIICYKNEYYFKNNCKEIENGTLIPKDKVLIAYELTNNGACPLKNKIKNCVFFKEASYSACEKCKNYEPLQIDFSKEVYISGDEPDLLELQSGEIVIKDDALHHCIKKRNKKWYLRTDVPVKNNNQLIFTGMK